MGNDRTFGLDAPSRSGKRQVRVIEVERLRVFGESGAAPRVGTKHVVRVEAGDAGSRPEAYLEREIDCSVCRLFRDAAGFAGGCDSGDDGVVNGTCL